MLRTLADVERELVKCNLLYDEGIYDEKEYAKNLKHLYECANYMKHYNKTYTTKAVNKTKQKTKKRK